MKHTDKVWKFPKGSDFWPFESNNLNHLSIEVARAAAKRAGILTEDNKLHPSYLPPAMMAPAYEGKVKGLSEKGKALRANHGKRRLSLLPMDVLEPIVEVLEFGAQKYAAWNFAEGDGLSWTEVSESLQRHLNAWNRGEDIDPESGKSHLGHIGCNLFFLLYYMKYAERYDVRDDRFKR